MRIMLTDSSDTCLAVAAGLVRDGHEVFDACLPDSSRQHECRGLRSNTCPLEGGVDLAITTLERPQDVASAGTVCSRRAGVPVITVGHHDADHPDLGPALRQLATHGDDHIAWKVQQALTGALAAIGRTEGSVEVVRDANRERIIARIPGPISTPERSNVAVRLLDAATASGRKTTRRDVIVQAT